MLRRPNPRHAVARLLRAAGFAWATLVAAAAQANGYAITDLGSLGGSFSVARGINASGQVVGHSYTEGDQAAHAFVYAGGAMRDLGTLGGSASYAEAIDDRGRVSGTAWTAGNASLRAFVFQDGRMVDRGPAPAAAERALLTTAAGEAAGSACIGAGAFPHAFRYARDGTLQDLGTLGGSSSFAYGINEAGEVVGSSGVSGGDGAHAFVFRDGAMRDLNELAAAAAAGWVLQSARAINASGQIVGFGTHEGRTAAFLLTPVPGGAQDVPAADRDRLQRIASR